MIEKKNTRHLRGISIGLAIVAMFAVIAAIVIGYIKDGSVNYLMIGIAAVILSANVLALKKRKPDSGD